MPAFPAAVGFAAGITATEWGYAWTCAIASAIAFAVLYASRRHYAAFIALAAAAGALLAIARAPVPVPEIAENKFVLCSGTLVSESIGENAQKCVVSIDSADGHACRPPFRCVVYNRHISPGLLPGSRVEFSADILPVIASDGLPYEADYGKYLKYDGITAQAVIYNESLDVTARPGFWHSIVNTVRESMADGISQSGVSPQTAAFLLTTILGEDDFLSPDISSGFRSAGLSHILALSGLHVGIITSFLMLLLFPLRLMPGGRRAQSAITMILIWAYAIATGLSPSVTRAAMMLSVMILARLLERGNFSFNSLCVALIVVLVINPYSLFTPGLQMSFAAVGSILLAVRLMPKNINAHPTIAFLLTLVIVPISAMLGTGIIGAYYFHSFPLLFLPANIAMSLLFPLLLAAGIALMLATMAGLHATWLTATADFLYQAVTGVSAAFAGGASWRGIFFSAWAIAPYWIGLILIFEYLKRRLSDEYEYDRHRRAFLIWGSAFMLVAASIVIGLHEPTPKAELYIPDLYPQAIVTVTPDHAYLLPIGKRIDPVEAVERYNDRYATFLMSRGHERFEIMPDSVSTGPFYRNGPFLLAADRLIYIADSDTLPSPPAKPYLTLIGSGYTGPLEKIASAGDSIIICKGVNGNRASYLHRQCGDSIQLASSTLTLIY